MPHQFKIRKGAALVMKKYNIGIGRPGFLFICWNNDTIVDKTAKKSMNIECVVNNSNSDVALAILIRIFSISQRSERGKTKKESSNN